MKRIALSISGYPIQLPSPIAALNNQAGNFGVNIFRLAANLLGVAAILLTLFVFLYGGWLWLTSEGDKKKIETAQGTLVFAVIGLIVVICSFFLISILGAFFNVPIFTLGK